MRDDHPFCWQQKIHAHQWFFIAACVYALLIIPMTVFARAGFAPVILAVPAMHAYEMLFGYALALIAGYLLGPMPAWHLLLLLGLWLVARVSALTGDWGWLSLASNSGFAMLLAWRLLPRLWVAKKWRNRLLAPLLGLICAAAIVTGLTGQISAFEWSRHLLDESVQLFALLMLFMGGRMLAPAAAGEFYRQGMELEARVQPHIEGWLIVMVLASVVLSPVIAPVAGMMLIVAGMLAGIRLLRWQLWHCLARPDLICLGLGYAWLALGLILLGWVKLSGEKEYFSAVVHAITIGALGTLSTNVIVRVTLLHVKQYPSHIRLILTITMLMSLAAIGRISADFFGYRDDWLILAACAWSAGFLLVLYILISCIGARASLSR
ncbi:MAG TPA: NnrS family protein [Nitrosomonas mobilis]|nr:NnrS family protein [Nitrosomonas mobilis]